MSSSLLFRSAALVLILAVAVGITARLVTNRQREASFQESYDKTRTAADRLHNSGLHQQAIEILTFSAEIAAAHQQYRLAASALLSVANYQREGVKDIGAARATYAEAILLARHSDDDRQLSEIERYDAIALSDVGDYQKAVRRLEEASRNLPHRKTYDHAHTRGWVYLDLAEAILQVYEREAWGTSRRAQLLQEARTRLGQAHDEFEFFFAKAPSSQTGDRQPLANVLRAQADLSSLAGHHRDAIDYYEKAASEYTASFSAVPGWGPKEGVALCMDGIGRETRALARTHKEVRQACAFYADAAREKLAVEGTPGVPPYIAARCTAGAANSLAQLGCIHKEIGDRELAEAEFRCAIGFAEAEFDRLGAELGGIFWGYKVDADAALVSLLLDDGRMEEAFWCAESSKAKGLRTHLQSPSKTSERQSDGPAGCPSTGPTEMLHKLVAYDVNRARYQEPSRDVVHGILSTAVDAASVEAMRRDASSLVEDGEAQREAFLSYFFVDGQLIGWFVTPDRFDRFECQEPSRIVSDVLELHTILSAPASTNSAGRAHKLSRRLFRELVVPSGLRPEEIDRLIVSPDGVLHLLPFEVLLVDKDDPESYLIEHASVCYVESAVVLAELKRAKPVPAGGAEAIIFDGISQGKERCQTEAKGVASLWGPESTKIVWSDQKETANPEKLCQGTAILHFACHATTNRIFPELSSLTLNSDREAETAFTASEICQLDLNKIPLVVLSACSTSKGRLLPKEGVDGLARSFRWAGAPSVVTTLWEVGGEKCQQIMERFYRNLKEGCDKDEALRQAKLETCRGADSRLLSPFWWGPFILQGDWR